MKSKINYLSILLSLLLIVSTAFCFCSCQEQIDPPAKVDKVYSISLQYNNDKINGVLSVDLSVGTVQLGTAIEKDEGFTSSATYSSSVEKVATIDNTGLLTLVAEGETVISATLGDKSHQIVLVVGDDFSETASSYVITVNGGRANVSKAKAGELVTLTAEIPAHKDFIRWKYGSDNEEIWQNGNVIKMPAKNLVVTAIYEDMLYTLNVVGAVVTSDGSQEFTQKAKNGGNTQGGTAAEYNMAVYHFTYDTPISIKAIDAPAGKMFVGWDYGMENNRVGEMGDPEYGPFNMPDETLTVWGIFSNETKKVLTASSGPWGFYDANKGAKLINNGAPEGESSDEELQGLSGYRLTIAGNTGAAGDYPENITGSVLDTTKLGSQTVKAVFKNHHSTLSVTVEIYATYYGNLTTSGNITIGPGERVIKYFSAGLGINDPWMGFNVRKAVGGTSSDTVLLDMVVGAAPTYPNGDKLLQVSGAAEYVNIGNYTRGGSWPGRPMLVNNAVGLSSIACYAGNFGGLVNGYINAPIQNMPKYDKNSEFTTIYVKVINNVNNNPKPTGTFTFAVGTKNNPVSGESGAMLASKEIVITKIGQMEVFALKVPRTALDNGTFYFSIIKSAIDSSDSLWGHNISVQLTYNNVMGYEEK